MSNLFNLIKQNIIKRCFYEVDTDILLGIVFSFVSLNEGSILFLIPKKYGYTAEVLQQMPCFNALEQLFGKKLILQIRESAEDASVRLSIAMEIESEDWKTLQEYLTDTRLRYYETFDLIKRLFDAPHYIRDEDIRYIQVTKSDMIINLYPKYRYVWVNRPSSSSNND